MRWLNSSEADFLAAYVVIGFAIGGAGYALVQWLVFRGVL